MILKIILCSFDGEEITTLPHITNTLQKLANNGIILQPATRIETPLNENGLDFTAILGVKLIPNPDMPILKYFINHE